MACGTTTPHRATTRPACAWTPALSVHERPPQPAARRPRRPCACAAHATHRHSSSSRTARRREYPPGICPAHTGAARRLRRRTPICPFRSHPHTQAHTHNRKIAYAALPMTLVLCTLAGSRPNHREGGARPSGEPRAHLVLPFATSTSHTPEEPRVPARTGYAAHTLRNESQLPVQSADPS